ncbi:MAG: hypothetical protein JF621_07880 [Streptomyces turgidiscabies]|nr:hypothetical protein [Streptomyces turgidiscabies]
MAADADKFRWPGPAILIMTLCIVFLISCIQCSFNALSHLITPADLDTWHGNTQRPPDVVLMQIQQVELRKWERESVKAVHRYNLGVTTLGFGAAVALAPPEGASVGHLVFRWSACGIVALATVNVSITAVRVWNSTRSN